jgi:hypothetical protein
MLFQVVAAILSSMIVRRFPPRLLYISCVTCVLIGDFSLATFSYLKANADSAMVTFKSGANPKIFEFTIKHRF